MNKIECYSCGITFHLNKDLNFIEEEVVEDGPGEDYTYYNLKLKELPEFEAYFSKCGDTESSSVGGEVCSNILLSDESPKLKKVADFFIPLIEKMTYTPPDAFKIKAIAMADGRHIEMGSNSIELEFNNEVK